MNKSFSYYWNNPKTAVIYLSSCAALTLVYAFTGRLGLSLDAVSGFATLVWPPAGIALGTLLVFGIRYWPGIFVGAFLVNYPISNVFVATGIGIGNTLEAVVAVVLLTRALHFQTNLNKLFDVLYFLLIGVLSPIVAASVGLICLFLSNTVAMTDVWGTWKAWWLGDLMGIYLIAPLFLAWTPPNFGNLKVTKIIEACLISFSIILLSVLVFSHFTFGSLDNRTLSYLFFPLSIWAALRFKMGGVVVFNFLVAAIATVCTSKTSGPFVKDTLSESLIYLQIFLGSLISSSMTLAATVQEYESSQQAAEAANEAKGNFIATISHEIRTPLSIVTGFAEILSTDELPAAERNDYLLMIAKNGKQLTELVDSILDFSKIESNNFQIEITPIKVREFFKEIYYGAKFKSDQKKLLLQMNLEENLPEFIQSDSMRFRQILDNIIGNAIKFTQRGSVTITAGSISENHIRVRVQDTGIGVTAEQRPRLFRLFSQGDNSMTRKFGGTGLGLVISKQLAQSLGGDIELLQSDVKSGATFDITIATKPIK